MSQAKKMIVAFCNEDLSWVHKIKVDEMYIYNKSKAKMIVNTLNSRVSVFNLPNVGREGQTYLYHIVANYANLDGLYLFTQAKISDARDPVKDDIYEYFREAEINGFCASKYHVYRLEDWMRPPIHGKGNGKHDIALRSGTMLMTDEKIYDFVSRHLGPLPLLTPVTYNGIFCVKAELIKSRPKSFYQALLEEMSEHANPLIGHYLERMWCYIFTQYQRI